MNFGTGGSGGDAAKHESLNQKCVGGAEDRADIVKAANVVKHYDDGQFALFFIFFNAVALQVPNRFLFHVAKLRTNGHFINTNVNKVCKWLSINCQIVDNLWITVLIAVREWPFGT